MDRILQSTASTIQVTFNVDGVPTTSATAVTVTITRDDGTAMVTNAATTAGAGTGVYQYTLTAAQTAQLDVLTAAWSGTITGNAQTLKTTVEIVGGFMFTIDQARTAMGDATLSAAKIAEARTYAETELEGELNYAVVPRYARDTPIAGPSYGLWLRPFLRSVRGATVAGVALTSTELTSLVLNQGFVYGFSWPRPLLSTTAPPSPVTIRYEHGLDIPPPGATRAALAVAVEFLGGGTTGSIDPRAESIITDDGTIRLRSGDGPFTAPGVNAWVSSNRLPVIG